MLRSTAGASEKYRGYATVHNSRLAINGRTGCADWATSAPQRSHGDEHEQLVVM
jgi:hypothetical protein